MKLEGEQTLSGSPERVWDILLDPDTISSILPGCKEFEQTGEDQYRGVIEAKVGPISSTYRTQFKVRDKDYPRGYRLEVEGQGTGGFVNGGARITLEGQDGQTLMRYSGDANVGGRIARVGQRLVDTVAKMMVRQGFKDLGNKVEERLRAEGEGTSGP